MFIGLSFSEEKLRMSGGVGRAGRGEVRGTGKKGGRGSCAWGIKIKHY